MCYFEKRLLTPKQDATVYVMDIVILYTYLFLFPLTSFVVFSAAFSFEKLPSA